MTFFSVSTLTEYAYLGVQHPPDKVLDAVLAAMSEALQE